MSWIWWVIFGILGLNVLFFGTLVLAALIDDWRHGRHE